jgi:SagB-type dehydrogenase family enzyme
VRQFPYDECMSSRKPGPERSSGILDQPHELKLTLAPGVTRNWSGLAGLTGQTQLTDKPLLDALVHGALLDELLEVGTPRAGRDVRGILDALHARQLLAWQVRGAEGTAWATLTPLRANVPLPVPAQVGGDVRLSRFALMRDAGGVWLLESGRSPFTATLTPGAAAAVVAGDVPLALHEMLQMGQLLDDSDDEGSSRYWEFHDRYFASRSRFDSAAKGATFRFADAHDPEPFDVRPPHQDRTVTLPVPDPAEPGPGLWEVIEKRRSHPDLGDESVELRELGALLWHTLRVVAWLPRDSSSAASYDSVRRPVPSGGGTHSIGLWLAIRDVVGIESGVWWYDPGEHALLRTCDYPKEPIVGDYPVYGWLISRHARLAWKYEGIAHALALKDAGVTLHALQLGATALGLAMCPIGSGPTAAVLDALGLDADEYIPVGEFWLARAN